MEEYIIRVCFYTWLLSCLLISVKHLHVFICFFYSGQSSAVYKPVITWPITRKIPWILSDLCELFYMITELVIKKNLSVLHRGVLCLCYKSCSIIGSFSVVEKLKYGSVFKASLQHSGSIYLRWPNSYFHAEHKKDTSERFEACSFLPLNFGFRRSYN